MLDIVVHVDGTLGFESDQGKSGWSKCLHGCDFVLCEHDLGSAKFPVVLKVARHQELSGVGTDVGGYCLHLANRVSHCVNVPVRSLALWDDKIEGLDPDFQTRCQFEWKVTCDASLVFFPLNSN